MKITKLTINGGKPVRSKDNFLVLGELLIEEPEIEEDVDCMRRRWIGTGPKVLKFEEDFAAYKGTKNAVALHTCTAALHLAKFAAGIASDLVTK